MKYGYHERMAVCTAADFAYCLHDGQIGTPIDSTADGSAASHPQVARRWLAGGLRPLTVGQNVNLEVTQDLLAMMEVAEVDDTTELPPTVVLKADSEGSMTPAHNT